MTTRLNNLETFALPSSRLRGGRQGGGVIKSCSRLVFATMLVLTSCLSVAAQSETQESQVAGGQASPVASADDPAVSSLASVSQSIAHHPGARASLQTAMTFATLAIVPLVLLMTTGYVRMAVVLGLLRQGFGAASAPPPQVTTALAVFLTVLVMMPVWQQVKRDAVDPYLAAENPIPLEQAVAQGVEPVKRFMSQQLIATGNAQDVWLFFKYLPEEQRQTIPKTFQEVPLQVLVPAFMVSELKVAFAIGFQIYLPFLLIDLLVSSTITALGITSLPQHVVSLPLKLALFVMVDGWNLIVGMLLRSFTAMAV